MIYHMLLIFYFYLTLYSAGAQGWQPYHHPVPLSWNLGTLTSWNSLGHSRPVTGLLLLCFNPLLHAPNSHFLYVGGVLPFRFPSSNPSISKFPFLSLMLQRNIRIYSSFLHSPFMSCHVTSCHVMSCHVIHPFLLPFFLSLPLISTRCRFTGLLLHLIAFNKTHTHTHTIGRSPLDEGSACRRNFCLTTHNNHKRQIAMPPSGFETPTTRYPRLRPCGHWVRLRYVLF